MVVIFLWNCIFCLLKALLKFPYLREKSDGPVDESHCQNAITQFRDQNPFENLIYIHMKKKLGQ